MISKDTAADIWHTYREIEAGEKLLADIIETRGKYPGDPFAPKIRDTFGREQGLQLGIPSGENGHRLFSVQPQLAEAVIRAHIEHKRAELATVQERARIELAGASPSTAVDSSGAD